MVGTTDADSVGPDLRRPYTQFAAVLLNGIALPDKPAVAPAPLMAIHHGRALYAERRTPGSEYAWKNSLYDLENGAFLC